MFRFSKKGREITKIYNGLIQVVSGVNINPFIGYIDTFDIEPFSKYINIEYIRENRHHEENLFGVIIKIEDMEKEEVHIEMSLTPLNITLELWDKGQKQLIEKLVTQINDGENPFDIPSQRAYESLTTSKICSRISQEYGIQFYTKFSYANYSQELMEKNLLCLLAYSTKCCEVIEEKFILNTKISV